MLTTQFQDEEQIRYMFHVPQPYYVEDAHRFLKSTEIDPDVLELGILCKEGEWFIGLISLAVSDWDVRGF